MAAIVYSPKNSEKQIAEALRMLADHVEKYGVRHASFDVRTVRGQRTGRPYTRSDFSVTLKVRV